MTTRNSIVALCAGALITLGGCPPTNTDNGGPANDNGTGGAAADGGGEVATGILVTTPLGAAGTFDLYSGDGQTRLAQAQDMNKVVATAAGTYRLTDYFNAVFVLAPEVVVVAGQVTTVPMGGLRVTTIAGSAPATYDIYSGENDTLLERPNDSDVIVAVPPGTYRLRKYFNDAFVYGEVTVAAGSVTAVPMGAFKLITPDGADEASYDVYTADGQTLLSRPNDDNTVVPLPPGEYRIMEYFSDRLTYTTISVAAGELATFTMGAVRYNGPESSYDIYDASGSNLLVRPASKGAVRPMPPGEYVLKDYFSDTVLGGVTVRAGEVTDAP